MAPSRIDRLMLLALAIAAAGTGCVHRRMTIESNPAGALVMVDGKEVGYTPVSVDFTYYGTREVTLIKDGYRTRTVPATLSTPWYQVFPLEFFTDNFLPYQVTNRHRFQYELQPVTPADTNTDELLNRGNAFRSQALMSQ